jgi:hypothetical protein
VQRLLLLGKSIFSERNYLAPSIGAIVACAIGAMAAQAAGPTADYKIDPKYTTTSPDGTTTIEQYARIAADGSYAWQFWARHEDKLTLLKPEQPTHKTKSEKRVGLHYTRFRRIAL